jgi:hypothetical protein
VAIRDHQEHCPISSMFSLKQVLEFANIILEKHGCLLPCRDRSAYPLGLITVAQGAAIDSQTNKLFVVDGQQCLITLCLILGALKCRLEARLKDSADVNEKQQLTNLITRLSSKLWDEGDTLLDRPPSPRTELKRKDAKFFNKLLQDPMEFIGQKYDVKVLEGESHLNIWHNLQVRQRSV